MYDLLASDIYNVVEFQSSKRHKQICVVPVEWVVDEQTCVWPPYRKQKQIDEAIKCRKLPEDSWQVFAIRILGSAGMLLLYIAVTLLFSGMQMTNDGLCETHHRRVLLFST